MNNAGLIQVAAYAFKRGEQDYWPAIAIFTFDEQGREVKLCYAEPGYGKGLRGPGFATEEAALNAAKEISGPHFDNGVLKVTYRGQVYAAERL
ncbi:hypothetical protein FOC29_28260 [Burkholderia vietnamiensis]|uniref:hypothetical protein n=1 Tax=Burkholderia vietnamiensis TaxID=60552 RepID=UPI001EE5602E|nr:hypothetical protein [Burkholderia vietnamiensis]UKV75205.1 hypothetical protein FOC29_28260 [Burkholderia vietnamiensis]